MLSDILFSGTAVLAAILAFAVVVRGKEPFVHRIFALGMLLFAAEQAFTSLSLHAILQDEKVFWQHLRVATAALLPGVWLTFSLTFGRANHREFLRKRKWVVSATFLAPVILAWFQPFPFFTGEPLYLDENGWVFGLGWSGYLFYAIWLLAATLIVANFERTLRSTVGRVRWQIKFALVGLAALFGVRIYTAIQAVLFSLWVLDLEWINAAGLIVACLFVSISLRRTRILKFDIYLSQAALYQSITIVAVGAYLLSVGVLIEFLRYFDLIPQAPLETILIFAALVILIIAMLSDRIQQDVRKFSRRHFRRPTYDYRQIWTRFTRNTTSLMEVKALCRAVAEMLSESIECLSVSVWTLDANQDQLHLRASTALGEGEIEAQEQMQKAHALLTLVRERPEILDFKEFRDRSVVAFRTDYADFLTFNHIRYVVPLISQQQLLGIITLGERVRYKPLTFEDFELLEVVADQTAAALMNLKLSQSLQQTREVEAFQNMSAFFVHDLKNLASRLSLTVQNLPVHFDNPDFREDALRTISQSVGKIKNLCGRLTMLKEKIELQPVEVDLNLLLQSIVEELKDSLNGSLVQDFSPVPPVHADPEQVQKVLVNLLLNAVEATNNRGEIRVATRQVDGSVVISVTDDGCGMSKDFLEHRLFLPFQTTKKQGMGIGLFHSKMIVEQHAGHIQVESVEGKGTTFRVFLPVQGPQPQLKLRNNGKE